MSERSENPGLKRVQYELRAAGVKEPKGSSLRSGIHTRGYLPHVKREGARYFVTFRLDDSLPRQVLLGYEQESAERLRALGQARENGWETEDSEEKIHRELRRKIERYLDRSAGDCHLRRPEIARRVVDALRYFDAQRYVLGEWVVMPNHVHTVVQPIQNQSLSNVVKSWKQFISTRANELLGHAGTRFWQPEAYDHWIRDDDEHSRIAAYIRRNPVIARLCASEADWPWSSAAQQ